MPAPFAVTNARVRVSLTSGGTYTSVGTVRSYEVTEGSEGETTLRYFGGESVMAGDLTLTGTIPVFWDRADTLGQKVLRDAHRAGTDVWLQICPEGTTAGLKCDQFQAKISEVSASADADGDAIEGSFSFIGVPSSLTEVTLA